MLLNIELLFVFKWFSFVIIGFFFLIVFGFILNWGFRFRLVGIIGFMGVLIVGLFGLSLGLFNWVEILGVVLYILVYDNGVI